MSEHALPEDKLLKLIRNKDRGRSAGAHDQKKAIDSTKSSGNKDGGGKFLGVLNNLFVILILIFLGISTYQFLFAPKKDIKDIRVSDRASKESETEKENLAFDLVSTKPITYYTSVAEERDLFEAGPVKKKTDVPTVVETTVDITKTFRLVGIVLDKTKEAIIEDIEGKQTLFLQKGDQLKDWTVDSIEEGKVVLQMGEQRVELTP